MNLYEYTKSQPIHYLDPQGLCTEGCPKVTYPTGPKLVPDGLQGSELIDRFKDYFQEHAVDYVGEALEMVNGLSAVVDLASGQIDKHDEQALFFIVVVPCKCGRGGGLLLDYFQPTPKGPANNGTGGYTEYGLTHAQFEKSMDIAKRDAAHEFNAWLSSQFSSCPTIKSYYMKE